MLIITKLAINDKKPRIATSLDQPGLSNRAKTAEKEKIATLSMAIPARPEVVTTACNGLSIVIVMTRELARLR